MFAVRLVAYEPGGARLGALPQPLSLQASFPHNDVGAMSASYSRLALRGEVLDRALSTGLELAVEVSGRDGAWAEPDGARFIWVAKDSDVADAMQVVQISAPSYGWLLGKARNLDDAHLLPADHSQAGKRPFYSASAGTILATLLGENRARAGVPVDLGFGSAKDSAGAAWAQVATLYYAPGVALSQVLASLAGQAMCDWRSRARTLHVWNADGVCARDRSASVLLRLGRDLGEAPSSESLEEMAGRLLVTGDAGARLVLESPSAPTPWGVWEESIDNGGVSDEATMRTLAQAELDRRARTRAQYTRALILSPQSAAWPLVDYRPGDWITAPTSVPAERVRVQQVTLTMDANGVGGALVLNDRVLDAELRRTKRLSGITGGSSAGGASGARPAPQGPDKRTPAAPLGLVVDSDAYIDAGGNPRGVLAIDWADVTTATDGTAMEIASYEIALRRNVAGAPWAIVWTTDEHPTGWGPLDVGSWQQVKVRARGLYASTPGAWSDVVTVRVADDVTPPPAPSALVASVRLGVVTIEWDGKGAGGVGMPADLARVDVYQEGVTARVGTIVDGAGQVVITDLPYGEAVRCRGIAVDRSGNASPAGAWSNSVTPTPLVAEDIDAEIIDSLEAIEQAAKAASTAAAAARDVAENALADADAAAQAAAAAAGVVATKSSVLIQSATPGTEYRTAATLWIDTTSGANTPKRWNGSGWVVVTDKAATDAAASAAAAMTAAQAAAAQALTASTAAGQAQASADGKNSVWYLATAPGGTHKDGDVWFDTSSGNAISVWSTSKWVPAQFGNAAIANAAISTGKLLDDAITAAKIATDAVTADAIAAGAVGQAELGAGAVTTAKLAAAAVDTAQLSAAVTASITSAQAKANAAADVATAAQLAATNAQTTADGKSRVTYGTAAPTSATPGRAGDVYWVVSGATIPTMYRCTAGTDKTSGNVWAAVTISGSALTDATIATGKILDDAISAAKIATSAVTADALASGAVGTAALASLSVTSAKIANLAVGTAQIADAAIVRAKIGNLAVGTAQIADGAIVTAKIGSAQITNALIADATITSAKIAALDAAKITTGYLASARIAAGSLTAAQLVAGTITAASGVIADAAIGTAKIIDAAITTAKIASLAVGTAQIGTAAVTSAKIANLAVGTAQIADAAIVRAKIGNLAVGTAQIADGAIVTAKIGSAQITNALIADATITSAKIAALDAAKITTGTLDAARIGAQTITTDKLIVASGLNAVPNGSFESDLAGWTTGARYSVVTSQYRTGAKCVQVAAAAATGTIRPLADIPVQAGERWRFTAWCKTTADYNGTASNGKLRIGSASGALLGAVAWPTATGWTQVTWTYTVPAGVAALRPEITSDHTVGTLWVDDVSATRMADGELIVDGVVTTAKLAAGAVTANAIAANAITSAKIAVGALDGYVITGATIRTAASGARLELNSTTLRAWDADGVVTAQIAGSASTFTGATFRTAASGARTVMSTTGVQVYDSSSVEQVRLSGALTRGLAVRNPNSNTLTELAPVAFGAQSGWSSTTLIKAVAAARFADTRVSLSFKAPSTRLAIIVHSNAAYQGGPASVNDESAAVTLGVTVNGTAYNVDQGGAIPCNGGRISISGMRMVTVTAGATITITGNWVAAGYTGVSGQQLLSGYLGILAIPC